jgi:hypothetical protein
LDISPADSDLLVSRPRKEHSVREFFKIKFCQMTEPAIISELIARHNLTLDEQEIPRELLL